MMSAAVALLIASTSALAGGSTCFGSVGDGRLEQGVRLPVRGPNFSAYSSLAATVGRTYVHSTVLDVVVAAYAALERAAPGNVFVYGETGWASGGRIRPHRTHQNGLSVDFFVPVRDRTGRSVPLPTGVTNRFGYAIEFDKDARFEGYTIDFDAMAEALRHATWLVSAPASELHADRRVGAPRRALSRRLCCSVPAEAQRDRPSLTVA